LTGNTKAQEFCLSLTRKASESYFEILETWIYEGIIDDPFKEFLVEDKANESDEVILDEYVIVFIDCIVMWTKHMVIAFQSLLGESL
jgi:hypothetical protein